MWNVGCKVWDSFSHENGRGRGGGGGGGEGGGGGGVDMMDGLTFLGFL